jgi:anti-sigma factor RsiW
MTATKVGNDDLLLQAYCDDELDPASALEFERRMAADAALKAQYDKLIVLRGALRAMPLDDEPPHLQGRIDRALAGGRPQQRYRSWQALAAAAMIGAIFASAVANGRSSRLLRTISAVCSRRSLSTWPRPTGTRLSRGSRRVFRSRLRSSIWLHMASHLWEGELM